MTLRNALALSAVFTAAAVTGCAPSADAPTTVQTEAPAPSTAATAQNENGITPALWPELESPVGLDPAIEARIDELMSQMTLRHKVGQIIQADIGSITPDDLRTYPLGSVLNGGNSAPNGDNRSPASDWLALADEFYEASKDAYGDGVPFIPMIWGTDAVHGHNNIPGATVFPHNIGLGATRNPDLLERIGDVTAREIRVGGQEWTFAPTIAVVRDDRWGRTYEGYSENPDVTASYAGRLIEGIQGEVGSDDFLRGDNVIATAKHFLGDGGTDAGRDQGDTLDSEEELIKYHNAGYPPALDAGVQVVMASFNKWQGKKVTGHKGLLTDALKGRMGFDGFIVGDWNAHGQIEGCTNTDCPEALHAGLDMYMAPDSWRGLFDTTLAQAESGELDMDRLDDAVRRILRVKLRSGLFEEPKPSERAFAGDYDLLQSPEHKSVARDAVRQSLVLLKNNATASGERALPLSKDATILVAGDGADNMGKQSGGWTLSWQGTGNSKADFPGGSSIYDGIKRLAPGAVLSEDGSYDAKPDVAVVVFGEDPYAEFKGDRDNLAYSPSDDSDLQLLRKLKAEGIPVVSVFLSGRPMWVNRELNASDAFVAAWLPGSEGGYAADVLFADGYDFTGTLPYSWPRTAIQTPLNVGDDDYDPLFPFGYGLTYADPADVAEQPEEAGVELTGANLDTYLVAGKAQYPFKIQVQDSLGGTTAVTEQATSANAAIKVRSEDDGVQENTRRFTFEGTDTASFGMTADDPVDLSRQTTGDMAVYMRYRVRELGGEGPVTLMVGSDAGTVGTQDATALIESAPIDEWQELNVNLRCFAEGSAMTEVRDPIRVSTARPMILQVSDIRLVANEGQAACLD